MTLRAISRETFTLVTQEKSTQKSLITSYDMDFFCKMAVAFARIPKECVFGVLKDFRATTAQAQVHISSQEMMIEKIRQQVNDQLMLAPTSEDPRAYLAAGREPYNRYGVYESAEIEGNKRKRARV